MSVTYVQQPGAPMMTQGGQSFAMPDMFASPGLTMIAPQQQSVVYAAPQQSVVYAAPQQMTYAEPTQFASQLGGSVTYAAPSMSYAAQQPYELAAPQQYEYGAPAMYAAPAGNQPVYTITPERFQLIMQGQPLTNEEIAQMTGGGGQQAAPVMTQTQGGQSFMMPDMFASPGLTMVGAPQGQYGEAAPAAATASTVAAATSTPAPVAATSTAKKTSSKKSSKKKVSSKKKSKGCC